MLLKSEFFQGSQALYHSDSGCKLLAMRVETYSMNHTVYQKVEIIRKQSISSLEIQQQ